MDPPPPRVVIPAKAGTSPCFQTDIRLRGYDDTGFDMSGSNHYRLRP